MVESDIEDNMPSHRLTDWSAWNNPTRAKILSPLSGGFGVLLAYIFFDFVLGINQSSVIGLVISVFVVSVGFGSFWLLSMMILSVFD